jgi:DNA-binding MarR family transcriptional regulator
LVELMTQSPTTVPVTAPALPSRLRMVVTRLARRLRQQGEASASPTQLAALATIERDGPLTLGALAAIERVRPPTITAAVGRLEERGLVRRRVDARDRRVARVEITPQGRRLLAQSRSRKTAYLERQLAALTRDERDTLERAAEILERVLEKERS